MLEHSHPHPHPHPTLTPSGLVSYCATSQLLPVGWYHLLHSIHTTQKKGSKIDYSQSTNRSLRHLSNEKQLNQYSQAMFSLHQMLIG
jgi:hypothetical protein